MRWDRTDIRCHENFNVFFFFHRVGRIVPTPLGFLKRFLHPPPFTSALHPQGFLGGKFDNEIKDRADGIVNATIEVYERISKELLPTPAR